MDYTITVTYEIVVCEKNVEWIEENIYQATELGVGEGNITDLEIEEHEIEELESENMGDEKYTLVLIEYHTTGKEWGDHFKLHAKGCGAVNRCNVEWKWDFQTIDDAVHGAYQDFINEGMSMKEARCYLSLCPCTKKVVE